MNYAYELENGQLLTLENHGDHTHVSLSSGGENQRQSQATGFTTGEWSKIPALYRLKKDLILHLETRDGARFLRVRGDVIQQMRSEPDLQQAEKLRLKKSEDSPGMQRLEPMPPMKPMQPMEPMKPMPAMKPMGPMEMRMGDMRMSMGGGDEPRTARQVQRFCTECGEPVAEGDRFCAHCGHRLNAA